MFSIGFDAVDWLEFGLTALLVSMALVWRGPLARTALRLASRTRLTMLGLAVSPVFLRLLLLRRHPIPAPAVPDDFSYLLIADTLFHQRLANPAHPMHRFFETFFVLQEPTYSSIFPL